MCKYVLNYATRVILKKKMENCKIEKNALFAKTSDF